MAIFEKDSFFPPGFFIVLIGIFSLVLPPQAVVGQRVLLGYRGLGIVFHPETVVGDDVIVGPHVVFGGRTGREGAPHIGNGCVIGSGAAVLGAVALGENAKVGSNSVVLSDVPSNATAVGVPARVIE